VNVRFLCTAFSLVLLSACSSTPKIADIQIKANWCADHLDTRAGTCTKDLISDGDTTIALQFTYAERAYILDTARALGFFQLPHEVSVVSEMEIIGSDTLYTFQFTEPSCRCSIRIESGDETHWVEWDIMDSGTPAVRKKLRWLLEEIWRIIESKPEYKALPPPRGMYI